MQEEVAEEVEEVAVAEDVVERVAVEVMVDRSFRSGAINFKSVPQAY